ncbi:MAG: lipopolysaccharide biosynthesis protein [Methylococcales bacterium]|nr:lipopolysaccharide biosynthesis protein [Methylococcales bacterium]
MENQAPDIKDYLKIIKRRKKFVIIPFLAIFLLSIILSVVLPSVFRSTATILIEEQEIPSELVRSTVTTFADQRIQIISQRIMSRVNLMEIIKKYDLYAADLKTKTEERILDKMRKSIKVETVSADVIDPRNGVPTKATIAFILAFDSPSPSLAQKVANELVSLFLKENIKSRTESADNAAIFLSEEKRHLKERIQEIQAKVAEFKKNNLNRLPEANSINQQEITTINNQLMLLDSQERSAAEHKFYLEGQLAQIDPNTSATNAVGQKVFDMHDRLKELQAQYPSLISRYSETHPDLVKIKHEIESLQKQIGSSADIASLNAELTEKKSAYTSLLKQYSDKHPDVQKLQKEITALQQAILDTKTQEFTNNEIKPDNPAYISTQTQLAAVDSDIRSLAQSRTMLNEKLEKLRKNMREAPLIEKEYMDMLQELDNTNNRYRGVDAREMEAQIAQQLEIQKKGERFTLIDPPQEPLEAYSPNRMVILILGFVVAIAGGFGALAMAEVLDSNIHSERTITQLLGVPPLATIPYLENHKESENRKNHRKTLLLIGLTGSIAAVIAFHFIVMPLDVFWYKLLRIIGTF